MQVAVAAWAVGMIREAVSLVKKLSEKIDALKSIAPIKAVLSARLKSIVKCVSGVAGCTVRSIRDLGSGNKIVTETISQD